MLDNTESFCPSGKEEWREWLQKHHEEKQSVWLICYKKSSGKPVLSWSDAVDEALCFGWIDSVRRPVDVEKFRMFFCKRKPKSVWSKVNKDKIQRLMELELMAPAGLRSVEIAKANGQWTQLDRVEALEIPEELEEKFRDVAGSREYFMSLSRTVRKLHLYQLSQAKRPETRQKRISGIVALYVAHQL